MTEAGHDEAGRRGARCGPGSCGVHGIVEWMFVLVLGMWYSKSFANHAPRSGGRVRRVVHGFWWGSLWVAEAVPTLLAWDQQSSMRLLRCEF